MTSSEACPTRLRMTGLTISKSSVEEWTSTSTFVVKRETYSRFDTRKRSIRTRTAGNSVRASSHEEMSSTGCHYRGDQSGYQLRANSSTALRTSGNTLLKYGKR